MEISRVEAVCEAMTWCLTWGHELEPLELSNAELNDLLTERVDDNGLSMGRLQGVGSGNYKLFGVEIKQAEFPRKSMIRTRYLQLINSPVWIEWLAQEMEQYA